MAKSYYSIVLDHPADDVWSVIRPFGHYAWAGVESNTIIEDGKAGRDAHFEQQRFAKWLGALRRFMANSDAQDAQR